MPLPPIMNITSRRLSWQGRAKYECVIVNCCALTGEVTLTADIAENISEWYGYMVDPLGWATMPCDDNPGTLTLLGGTGLGRCHLVGDAPITAANGNTRRELQFQGVGYPP